MITRISIQKEKFFMSEYSIHVEYFSQDENKLVWADEFYGSLGQCLFEACAIAQEQKINVEMI